MLTPQAANRLDREDPLAGFRHKFSFPNYGRTHNVYFTGHSLGLQPKAAITAVEAELARWQTLAVEGHFEGDNPWVSFHEPVAHNMAELVGARPSEVTCMQSLTANLHLLFVSFYRPSASRFKILCEHSPFPSDQYLLQTQVKWHGLEPGDTIVELKPRAGEQILRQTDIERKIQELGDSLALVFFGGVNYLSGQLFDMQAVTKSAHDVGAVAGFDLAHAAGNVPMALHDWGVDFAAWCTYKYLNGGPGSAGALFVHDRYAQRFELPRFGGWWGHDKSRRFLMEPDFQPMAGAEGWQLSNAPVLSIAPLAASLGLFAEAGMSALRAKSLELTARLEEWISYLQAEFPSAQIRQITPAEPEKRGAQLSVEIAGRDRAFFEELIAAGLHCDFREPNMIRFAPAPLYNSFSDVGAFGEALESLLRQTT